MRPSEPANWQAGLVQFSDFRLKLNKPAGTLSAALAFTTEQPLLSVGILADNSFQLTAFTITDVLFTPQTKGLLNKFCKQNLRTYLETNLRKSHGFRFIFKTQSLLTELAR